MPGIHTKWYLHSHMVWLKLWLSYMGSLLFLNFERFRFGDFPYIPVNIKLWESPGRAGGLPVLIMTRHCRGVGYPCRYGQDRKEGASIKKGNRPKKDQFRYSVIRLHHPHRCHLQKKIVRSGVDKLTFVRYTYDII